MECSSGAGIAEGCDGKLKHLHEKVERIKANSQMEVSYVRTREWERLIREEGKTRKLLEMISKKLRKGDSQEKIADDLCEELAVVQRFSEALQNSPEQDLDIALEYLENAGE